jgi:hypothetical protein
MDSNLVAILILLAAVFLSWGVVVYACLTR